MQPVQRRSAMRTKLYVRGTALWRYQRTSGDKKTSHPHEIQVDVGKVYRLAGITYLPRQDMTNGRIADYECYVSTKPDDWGEPVAKSTFKNENKQQQVLFDEPLEARYVRLVALSEVNKEYYTTVAELGIIPADSSQK